MAASPSPHPFDDRLPERTVKTFECIVREVTSIRSLTVYQRHELQVQQERLASARTRQIAMHADIVATQHRLGIRF